LLFGRLAIAAGLAEHQDKFDIVFDDRIGFVGFSKEPGSTVFDFVFCVGDFVPKDRSEIVEADFAAANDYVCMEGHNHMAAVALAREANVTYDADDAPTRNKDAQAVSPDAIKFIMELLVIRNETELALVLGIFLESPVGRRGYDKVDRCVGDPIEFASIAASKKLICLLDLKRSGVHCWNDRVSESGIQSKTVGQVGLRISWRVFVSHSSERLSKQGASRECQSLRRKRDMSKEYVERGWRVLGGGDTVARSSSGGEGRS